MTEINIFNVYDFVTYEYDITKCRMIVTWDKRNKSINKIMETEWYQSITRKNGCFWVEKLKEITNWCEGDIINILPPFPNNGAMYIAWEFNRTLSARQTVILGDGYFYTRDYKQDYNPFVKVNCLYNDLLDDEIMSYVLK
jgi:hypothetical protein